MVFSLLKNKKEDLPEKEIKTNVKQDKNTNQEELPKKPRKKKIPTRPWERKDRILVLIILLLSAGISMFLAGSSRGWKFPGLPRIDLSNYSLLKEETVVIKKEETTSPKTNAVLSKLEEVTKDLSGVYGIKIVDLKSDSQINIYADETFPAASLIKLPVMAAMLQEAEYGNIDLNEEYALKSTDKIPGAGSLYYKPDGYLVTYGEMVELMGKESDNTAFGICRNLLGDDKITKVAKQFGMYNTSIEDNTTSPSDIASFFKKLYEGDVLTKPSADKLLEYLTDTSYEKWLKPGIPKDIRLAHKYGTVSGTVNDAGIVYGEYPYIVVIVTKGIVQNEADAIFPELSRIIYDEMESEP